MAEAWAALIRVLAHEQLGDDGIDKADIIHAPQLGLSTAMRRIKRASDTLRSRERKAERGADYGRWVRDRQAFGKAEGVAAREQQAAETGDRNDAGEDEQAGDVRGCVGRRLRGIDEACLVT